MSERRALQQIRNMFIEPKTTKKQQKLINISDDIDSSEITKKQQQLIQGIRLDVWDQLNGHIVEEQKTHSQIAFINDKNRLINDNSFAGPDQRKAIDEMNNRKLKNNEYYIYEIYVRQNELHTTNMTHYHYLLCTITNYSNITWLELDCYNTGYSKNYFTPKKIIELNVPLHNIFIDIFMSLKKIPFINIYNYTVDFNCSWFQVLQDILNLNKKYYMDLLVNSDLQKKYEKSLDDNKKLQEEINKLKLEKDSIEHKLKDSVPLEMQCCICFGYTDKSQLLVPWGHSNFCITCINSIKECSVCRTNVERVQKIFK